jgi:hypothetical protein
MGKSFLSAKALFLVVAAATMVLAIAATAGAMGGDRNHDGIPDKWAKKHGLKANKNQANRDQDRDHVRNLCEYQSGMDPKDKNSDNDRRSDGREDADRDGMVNSVESEVQSGCDDADSDDDGQDDGDEISGYVHSLNNGTLKIRMVDGTILTAPVTEDTYVYCEQDEFVKEQNPEGETELKPEAEAANGGGSYEGNCGLEALTPGRIVKAFYIEDGDFVKLKLLN